MDRYKNFLNKLSGLGAFCVTFGFGVWLLMQPNSENQNVATWVMWTLLDCVCAFLAWKQSRNIPWLYVGWTFAAFFVTICTVLNGAVWHIGFAESVCIITVINAAYLLYTNKGGYGLLACAVAMFVAGIPQVIDFWSNPAKSTWWMWAGTAAVCMLSVLTSEKVKSMTNAPAFASTVFQLVTLLVLFRPAG